MGVVRASVGVREDSPGRRVAEVHEGAVGGEADGVCNPDRLVKQLDLKASPLII